jgi:hypothetical protein
VHDPLWAGQPPPDPALEVIRGGKLAGALRPAIDELVVKLHPVAVGSGVRCSTERSSHSGSS